MNTTITLADGKYTYVYDSGKQYALRYGEEWRDLTGDNLIYYMACEIDKLRTRVKELNSLLTALKDKDVYGSKN